MSLQNSRLILATNIKLNKTYIEVLSYEESDMLNLINKNKVYESSDYSFLRNNSNIIQVNANIKTIQKSNYLAFQNPAFSNKWFFAFIDEVNYISDATSEIKFTIDTWSTWFSYWNIQNSFVYREHTNNDSVGSNLVRENLETGEFVTNSSMGETRFLDGNLSGTQTYAIFNTIEKAIAGDYPRPTVGQVPTNGYLYAFDSTNSSAIKNFVDLVSSQEKNKIVNAWLVPKIAIDNGDGYPFVSNNIISGIITDTKNTDTTFSKPDSLNGYVPKNKKLLTGEFCNMVLKSNGGSANVLNYENFSSSSPKIRVSYSILSGGSGIAYPLNYKNEEKNITEGLSLAKFPLLPWNESYFQEYISKNALNTDVGAIGSGVIASVGIASLLAGQPLLGGGLLFSAANSVFENSIATYQASKVPDSIVGNVNISDLFLQMGRRNFASVTHMSIRSGFARKIDNFFTRFGYRIDDVKTPNIFGRRNFNYVKVGEESTPCLINMKNNIAIPNTELVELNALFKRGVTIWHSHENLGNYSVDNSII